MDYQVVTLAGAVVAVAVALGLGIHWTRHDVDFSRDYDKKNTISLFVGAALMLAMVGVVFIPIDRSDDRRHAEVRADLAHTQQTIHERWGVQIVEFSDGPEDGHTSGDVAFIDGSKSCSSHWIAKGNSVVLLDTRCQAGYPPKRGGG